MPECELSGSSCIYGRGRLDGLRLWHGILSEGILLTVSGRGKRTPGGRCALRNHSVLLCQFIWIMNMSL